ncbi:hypothetical protein CRG98_022868 [Punica granatum]|uniref:Uncharacterized protein n=1 Tax=Punica granatum TaxID=22663 RepID=A0A2I0JLF4_PUNGR|nr:hypothetical protein CRG98_022868 [Punica granatum]
MEDEAKEGGSLGNGWGGYGSPWVPQIMREVRDEVWVLIDRVFEALPKLVSQNGVLTTGTTPQELQQTPIPYPMGNAIRQARAHASCKSMGRRLCTLQICRAGARDLCKSIRYAPVHIANSPGKRPCILQVHGLGAYACCKFAGQAPVIFANPLGMRPCILQTRRASTRAPHNPQGNAPVHIVTHRASARASCNSPGRCLCLLRTHFL